MTDYEATAIAEGFCGYEPTQDQLQEAWQHLVDTGTCWVLQGHVGRTARDLLQAGHIEATTDTAQRVRGW